MTEQLNPFSFLGVSIDSSIDELKKKYYELSMICHPDKGGNKDDMIVLSNCYQYIKEQLKNKIPGNLSDSYLNLEEEFQKFCKLQSEEIPNFQLIYEETNDFIKHFNQEFEESINYKEHLESSPFNNGYGYLMEPNNIKLEDIEQDLKYPLNEDSNDPIKHINEKQITIYEEPTCINNNFDQYHDFTVSNIDDFSQQINNLQMTDYKIAHSQINIKDEYYINLGISKEKFDQIVDSKNNLDDLLSQRKKDDELYSKIKFKEKSKMEQSKKLVINNKNIYLSES